MTLKKAATRGVSPESSISLMVQANRWGNDGVGLLLVRDPRNSRNGETAHTSTVDREVLDHFLARIGHVDG